MPLVPPSPPPPSRALLGRRCRHPPCRPIPAMWCSVARAAAAGAAGAGAATAALADAATLADAACRGRPRCRRPRLADALAAYDSLPCGPSWRQCAVLRENVLDLQCSSYPFQSIYPFEWRAPRPPSASCRVCYGFVYFEFSSLQAKLRLNFFRKNSAARPAAGEKIMGSSPISGRAAFPAPLSVAAFSSLSSSSFPHSLSSYS
jgi:hypothetical protein